MKLNAYDNALETNAQVVSQDFTIGDASVIIDILRNRLYQHKVRTLIQEYMCNARDSHREKNTKQSIIVSVPNELSPVFKVRDFGPGITPDRMANVFCKYGSSTKRKTNGQTGGFGIGAKSAWAYTDSFTIVSITGGVKRTYVAHIGANKEGRCDLLSEVNTDEQAGTEIQIAINPQDCSEFRKSIFRASYFWNEKEKPEFRGLNQNVVKQWHNVGQMFGKEFEINEFSLPDFIGIHQYDDTCVLAIDGIPYEVNRDLVEKIPALEELLGKLNGKAIFHIGNGIVEVGADRERVSNDSGGITTKALATLAKNATDALAEHVKNTFKSAKTNAEWIKSFKTLSKLANIEEYSKFNDYRVNRGGIEHPKFSEIEIEHVCIKRKRRSGNMVLERGTNYQFIGLDSVDHVFWLDVTEPVVTQNRRLREYLEKSNLASIILISAKETYQKDPTPSPGSTPAMPKMVIKTSLADSKKTLTKVIKDFNATGLSCLSYTPVVRVPKAKRDRTKEMFTIHEVHNSGKSPNTTTIQAVEQESQTYLYVSFAEYEKYAAMLQGISKYLDGMKIIPCALTDDSIKMVQGSKKFVSFLEYKKNFKASNELLLDMKFIKSKNIKYMSLLRRSKQEVKDAHVAHMMVEYKPLITRLSISVPAAIVEWCKDDLAQFVSDDEKLTNLLENKYLLVKAVENGGEWRVSTEQVDELIWYINKKVKGK
jgi:hypothetical protein